MILIPKNEKKGTVPIIEGYNPEGYVMNMTYDGENRLKSAEYTDSGRGSKRGQAIF
jgi:hypothetical protein